MRKWSKVSILTILLFVNLSSLSYADFSKGYPTENITVTPAGPANIQTIKVQVNGSADAQPKVVWVQSDTEIWKATFDGGHSEETGTYRSGGDPKSALPLKKRTDFSLDMGVYAPASMQDKLGNRFEKQFIKELGIEDMDWTDDYSYEKVGSKPGFVKGALNANIKVSTGYGKLSNGNDLIVSEKYKYGTRYDGADKHMAEYYIPMLVNYSGYVTEKKQMRVLENANLAVNVTKSMKAEIRTMYYNMADFNNTWFDVSTNPETTWSSDNSAVAVVDPSTGKVTAKKEGTATITAKWDKDPYWLYATAKITVGSGTGTPDPDPDPDPDPGEPGEPNSVECTAPSPGSNMNGVDLNPSVSAVIKADSRGNEPFDVLQGIPTSESLYGNVWSKDYLHKYGYQQMTGTCTYTVNVTMPAEEPDPDAPALPEPPAPDPDAPPEEPSAPSSEQVTVVREYSFWTIINVEVHKIDEATLMNYAFNGNGIRISPSGYHSPYYATAQSSGYEPASVPETVEAMPNQDSQDAAEMAVGEVRVKNDTFTFYTQTLMNGSETGGHGSTPSAIPIAPMTGDNVLYSPGNMIPSSKTNKANQPSSGTIYYSQVNGSAKLNYPINGINTVTVHTPTVIYANASDDAAHNQKTTPNYSRRAFILDRNIKVYMPTSGQHRNIPGYGDRDYAKYIKTKQVRFEFDVYTADKSIFHPKDTWITVPVSELETTFFLPVWVDEGNYTVYFRSFAENSPSSGFTTESEANLNLVNHVATDTVPVEVIGRLYNFRITDIADPNWETVFRTAVGSPTPRGNSYWVGTKGIDGSANGSYAPYVLPILRGSHPVAAFKTMSVKTGYHFKFDLKSKGNMFEDKDAVRITPTFYFQDNVASTPAKRVEVDLYYHSDTAKFVKIGSPSDLDRRNIILDKRLRNVPVADIVNTAESIYDMNTGWSITRPQYLAAFQKRAKEPTYVGGYGFEILPSPLRTFINTFNRPDNASASPARTNASIQQWYGEYSLPAAVYVVAKGTDLPAYGRSNRLDEASPIFLRNGYISVNFNIETIRNADLKKPHLQYIHGPLNNQWWDMEGFDGADGVRDRIMTDPYGVQFILRDGDVIFYDANQSSYDDYAPNGTH
ncbi:DUF5704 domain-containing protein [Paenibacillus sp. FA6]|uniref:DUF5704 domain-containing protein n=1 Tax=Paenibacillus sp. FA6 TaxID=3413029 RepID=UPI003F65D781